MTSLGRFGFKKGRCVFRFEVSRTWNGGRSYTYFAGGEAASTLRELRRKLAIKHDALEATGGGSCKIEFTYFW